MIYIVVAVYIISYLTCRSNSLLTTLYAINLQASTFEIGMMQGLVALFPMIFAVYAGRVSDRYGYRYPFVLGSFGICLALLLPYLVKGKIFILYISQLIYGLSFIFLLVNMQNLVGGLSTAETRSQNYAIYSLGVSIANFFGPLVTGFTIDYIGYNKTYLILAILAATAGLLMLINVIKLPLPKLQEQEHKNNVGELLASKSLRKIFITSGIILIGVGIYEFYFPIYGERLGFSASIIGFLLSINAAAFFLVRFGMPWLVSKFGENTVFISCLLVSACAFFILPLFGSIPTLAFGSFIVGLSLGCGQPLSMVMAYSASPLGRTGEVLGVRLTVNKTVQFFVPIIFGSVGTLVGALPIFWANTLMMIGGSFYMFKDKKNKITSR
ncbi:MAG: MFS transporter [Desulfitobacteriia bacterium]|jgi:MFS family permease